MGRFGTTPRFVYSRRQRRPVFEKLDLSAMRSPGAAYREPRPAFPQLDPLLYKETVYPQAPEPYREIARYNVLDRWPYLRPADYEPDEEAWDYDAEPDETMFDGRALKVFDRVPRERPLTYEESVRRLALLGNLECETTAGQGPYGGRGEMPDLLKPWPEALDVADELVMGEATLADTGASPGDVGAHAVAVDATAVAPLEVDCSGLDRIVLGQEPTENSAEPDAWAPMAADPFEDEFAQAEHAFDQQLEDIAGEFHQQEQAFAEPDWGPAALLPEPEELAPAEPPDPLLQPPSPPGLGGYRF